MNIEKAIEQIESALKEHLHLLKITNEIHNPETLEGFYDYQTAHEAREGLDFITQQYK